MPAPNTSSTQPSPAQPHSLNDLVLFLRYRKYRSHFGYPSPQDPSSELWALISHDILSQSGVRLSEIEIMNYILQVEAIYAHGLNALTFGQPVHQLWGHYYSFIAYQESNGHVSMSNTGNGAIESRSHPRSAPSPKLIQEWTIDQKRFLWNMRHDTFREDFELTNGIGTTDIWSQIALDFNGKFNSLASAAELMRLLHDILRFREVEYADNGNSFETDVPGPSNETVVDQPSDSQSVTESDDHETAEILEDFKSLKDCAPTSAPMATTTESSPVRHVQLEYRENSSDMSEIRRILESAIKKSKSSKRRSRIINDPDTAQGSKTKSDAESTAKRRKRESEASVSPPSIVAVDDSSVIILSSDEPDSLNQPDPLLSGMTSEEIWKLELFRLRYQKYDLQFEQCAVGKKRVLYETLAAEFNRKFGLSFSATQIKPKLRVLGEMYDKGFNLSMKRPECWESKMPKHWERYSEIAMNRPSNRILNAIQAAQESTQTITDAYTVNMQAAEDRITTVVVARTSLQDAAQEFISAFSELTATIIDFLL